MNLLKCDHVKINEILDHLEKDVQSIKRAAMRIAWFSRGSIQYEHAMNFAKSELDIMNQLIESNLETTSKTRFPFF